MTSATNTAQRSQSPATAFADVLDAVVSSAASGLERKTRQWTDKLNGIAGGSGGDAVKDLADTGLRHAAEGGGAQQAAGAEGLRAGLQGRNPAWAAVKGAWSAGTPVVRAAIVAAFVGMAVLLLVSPVLLLAFLLSWLVIAAVMRARAQKKH